MNMAAEEAATSRSHVAGVIALYWFVSMSLVFINKKILTGGSVPLFLTWCQCGMTCLICAVCGVLGERVRRERLIKKDDKAMPKGSSFLVTFPRAEYDPMTAIKVMPLSIVFVIMIVFNQLTLLYVEVSFYNVARSLTIVFNAIFSVFLLNSRISLRTIICLAVVVTGFLVGTGGEVKASTFGVCCGVVSSVAASLNSIYTKKVLPHVQNNAWLLAFNNNANACLLFAPIVYLVEGNAIIQNFQTLVTPTFVGSVMISGSLGFAMGIVTVMQIRVTSPLTHNISGTAKAGVQSATAFLIWHNQPTFMGILGIVLVLFGSSLYTAVKIWEVQRESFPTEALLPIIDLQRSLSLPSS